MTFRFWKEECQHTSRQRDNTEYERREPGQAAILKWLELSFKVK